MQDGMNRERRAFCSRNIIEKAIVDHVLLKFYASCET